MRANKKCKAISKAKVFSSAATVEGTRMKKSAITPKRKMTRHFKAIKLTLQQLVDRMIKVFREAVEVVQKIKIWPRSRRNFKKDVSHVKLRSKTRTGMKAKEMPKKSISKVETTCRFMY